MLKRYQRGFVGGTGVIPIGDTQVVITHNLGSIPTSYEANPIKDSEGQDIYVLSDATLTATQMTVAIDFPHVIDVNFSWLVKG